MFDARVLLLGALALSPAALGATLSLSGVCPGPIDVVMTGTPGAEYMLVAADGRGATRVPSGECVGTVVPLAGGISVFGPFADDDGDGAYSLTPSVPGGACGKRMVVLDLGTCEVSRIETFEVEIAPNPECREYMEMTDAFRNVDWAYDYARCDSDLEPGWYRIGGDAGDQMPDFAPGDYSCGTHAPGWIGGHPARLGETSVETVCYDWSGDLSRCTWSHDLEVTNCGPFYVYNMIPPPWGCSGAYCGW